MCWQYLGTTAKSAAELNHLWKFIENPLFDSSVFPSFSHEREKKQVEKYLIDNTNPFQTEHGWCMSSVKIQLLKEKKKWSSAKDPDIPLLTINNIHHHCIIDIIVSVFEDSIASSFHMNPFKQYWKPFENFEPIRVGPGDNLECVVASLMMWSDATHLTSFGDASLWPFYLYFGKQSKYTCRKPTASACHHVAYIPAVCTLS
ncbi:hypothetical protein BS17DRAFT_795449 [Gyrodon lividus]|nr:hypothetical protein BS17DRAFT_795449 [Gyrodon lividus]